MSTYREIVGKKIKKVSSDPSSGLDGEMWYNSTSGSLKGLAISEAFLSVTSLSTARFATAGAGSQTASLITGGQTPPAAASTATEEYNGSGWATGGTLNTARYYIGGAGTQTSALAMSGRNPPAGWALANNEKYDGSSWTNSTAVPTALNQVTTTGTQTAGLLWGGVPSPGAAHVSTTYEFDGSSWASGGALPAGLKVAGAFGTQTAAMSAGNETGSTLYYDGSSWSDQSATVPYSGPDYWNYAGTSGTQTAGILMGGGPAANTTTAKWDGSTWSSNPAMAQQRNNGPMGPIGTSTAGLIASGYTGTVYTASAEEYNSSTNVVTAGAWAAGGAMTTARTGLASAGTQTANVFIGGQMSNSPNAPLDTVELYNGTAWSNNPNNAPYSASNNCGTGTQTAALSWGGYPNVTTTIEFDGSSFTAGGSLSTGRELTSNNIGIQTAAVAAGGYQRSPDTFPTQSEEYNGSAWTAGGAINTPRYSAAGAGTETAAVISGGIEPGQLSNAEEYNGSSWTNVTSRPYTGGNSGTSGTQTDALVFGGTPALTTTVGYDGTSWSTRPSLASGHAMMGSSAAGTSTAALASSGAAPTATEEFTGSTSTANIKTFTTS